VRWAVRSAKVRPAASAAMGTRLVVVRPGPVLTSRMLQMPSGVRMASTREMSRQPRARWAAWAASRQRLAVAWSRLAGTRNSAAPWV
jgi:hypothetical protein